LCGIIPVADVIKSGNKEAAMPPTNIFDRGNLSA